MTAAAKDLDLSVLPPACRTAFGALQARAARVAGLEQINRRLEHLVAELNHVVHGRKSEKLSEGDRQPAFEDLKIALAGVEEQKQTQAQTSRQAQSRQPARERNPTGAKRGSEKLRARSSGWSP